MNWNRIADNWTEFGEQARKRWEKLTKTDLAEARGDRGELIARLQKRYNLQKREAEQQVREWADTLEETTRQAAGDAARDVRQATSAVTSHVGQLQSKSIEFTEENLHAMLDHFRRMMEVQQPMDLVALNQAFLLRQFEAATRQMQTLTELTMGLTREASRPTQETASQAPGAAGRQAA